MWFEDQQMLVYFLQLFEIHTYHFSSSGGSPFICVFSGYFHLHLLPFGKHSKELS